MNERNHKVLKTGLTGLSEYTPAAGVWDRISGDLDHLAIQDAKLHLALQNLPAYAPPAAVWDDIEEQLPGKRVLLPWLRKALPYAAMIAGVALLAGLWYSRMQQPQVTVNSTTVPMAAFWEEPTEPFPEDEEAIQYVAEAFATDIVAQQYEEHDLLQMELEELTLAKTELEDLLSTYGKDPAIIDQLVDIELQRSEVVKKMTTLL